MKKKVILLKKKLIMNKYKLINNREDKCYICNNKIIEIYCGYEIESIKIIFCSHECYSSFMYTTKRQSSINICEECYYYEESKYYNNSCDSCNGGWKFRY